MNQRCALSIVIGVVVTLGACSGTPQTKSRFLSSFSAKEVIEKSFDSYRSDVGIRVSSGETSSVLLSNRRTYHRDDRADLNISQSDAPRFLQRVKEEIERRLQIAGCKITEAGSGDGSYSIAYTDDKVHGWIDIFGLVGMGDNYRLVIVVTEN